MRECFLAPRDKVLKRCSLTFLLHSTLLLIFLAVISMYRCGSIGDPDSVQIPHCEKASSYCAFSRSASSDHTSYIRRFLCSEMRRGYDTDGPDESKQRRCGTSFPSWSRVIFTYSDGKDIHLLYRIDRSPWVMLALSILTLFSYWILV